jgi:hypothetical protein
LTRWSMPITHQQCGSSGSMWYCSCTLGDTALACSSNLQQQQPACASERSALLHQE